MMKLEVPFAWTIDRQLLTLNKLSAEDKFYGPLWRFMFSMQSAFDCIPNISAESQLIIIFEDTQNCQALFDKYSSGRKYLRRRWYMSLRS